MTTINQLSSVDEVSASDQVPIYSASNGDARKAPMSVIKEYLQDELTSTGAFETQYSAPSATGFSVTVNPTTDGGNVFLLLTPAAEYAAGTIVLPELAECVDGQEILVSSTQAVTTLTVSGNGSTVNGAPTALTANSFFKMRFDGVFNAWYRIG